MKRAQGRNAPWIVVAGDAAILVRLGRHPGPTATRRVLALIAALDSTPPLGLLDVVPAYASTLIRFNPFLIDPMDMVAMLHSLLNRPSAGPLPRGRLVNIPVHYGGDFGPDLDNVAELLGLTPEKVIDRHASATYRVAFLGFLAGFPYLTGLPRALAVPRLSTPRRRVPSGSVAIADRQAGIYPTDSPGGWRILGRTSTPIFDPARRPPSLLRPGDRVRFYPVSASDLPSVASPVPQQTARHQAVEWLRVIQPGMQMTVQDHGRVGFARYGVTASGAADPDALALGNALLANPPEEAALEITGGNTQFEVLAPCVVAVTGAPCFIRVNQRQAPFGVTCALELGDTLEVGPALAGLRVYLCVAGGIAVPKVMGSRATDLRARLGGLGSRALRSGDTLERGHTQRDVAGRMLPVDLMRRLPGNGNWRLRILPGPHTAQSPSALDRLIKTSFVVDARSDRMGVRLRQIGGQCLEGGETLSEGLARGAIQIPPDGEPIVLLADAQTTGGYYVPAVVISADFWKIGQLRPGDAVGFCGVSMAEALTALRQRADEIARVTRQPLPEQLLAGFAEWSDDAELTMGQRKDCDGGE
ncbi:MAG TPA: 5-oxoprolinase subunit PxpB [Ktedonobacterales bacterium]|nr:5-oxoprolinase subunit PxpB [Ktedonobacterales bacterium]